MKLGFRVYEHEDADTGVKKYGVRLVPYSKIDEESVVRLALADSNINGQDLAAGFAALTQAIYDFVLNGHSVTLDGLGNFRLTCKTGVWDEQEQKWTSAGKNSEEDVSADDIRGVYVRFRPCTSLREQMKQATFFDVSKTVFGKKWAKPTNTPTVTPEP